MAVSFLTAAATLVLAFMKMKSRNAPTVSTECGGQGKLLDLHLTRNKYLFIAGKLRNSQSVCKFTILHVNVIFMDSGAFLPLSEIRKCVPEFSAANIVLLNLTVYNTGEMENSYR